MKTDNNLFGEKQILECLKSILSTSGKASEVAEFLCKIWCELLGASTAILWLYNQKFHEFDLLSLYCGKDEDYDILKSTPSQLSAESFASRTMKEPPSIIESKEPRSEPDWVSFTNDDEILEKYPHVLCVPFVEIKKQRGNDKQGLVAVIDLRFANIDIVKQPKDKLPILGNLSADAIVHAQEFEHKKIIEKLNWIALDLVNPKGGKVYKERQKIYFEELKKLICEVLHANCVSIFEADDSALTIRCCASTGIQGHTNLSEVFYHCGDGITWSVFENNQPQLVRDVRVWPEHKGKFHECRQIKPTIDQEPFLAVPMPGSDRKTATGVIRVLERTCYVNPDRLQNFSSHDCEILQHIAAQVSPVFQMMRLHSHRERFVERTAHQVIQPLQGIIAYGFNIIDGVYDSKEKENQKLRYIGAMAISAARMLRNCVWASSVTDFSFLRRAERNPQLLGRYLLEKIIAVQPIRDYEEIQVVLTDRPSVERIGEFLTEDLYFDQALLNVLHNAVKYSYPKTMVNVSANKDGGALVVNVKSTGVPIIGKERENIFWDRTRGKWANKYDPNGTGQGLFVTNEIMKGFGGEVKLVHCRENPAVNPPQGFPRAMCNIFQLILPETFK